MVYIYWYVLSTIYYQQKISSHSLLQKDLGAEDSILEKDHSTGICRLLYDTAPSGRFGTMTYLTKAVATYVQDFLPSGACTVQ